MQNQYSRKPTTAPWEHLWLWHEWRKTGSKKATKKQPEKLRDNNNNNSHNNRCDQDLQL